jgi:hypothetical protein
MRNDNFFLTHTEILVWAGAIFIVSLLLVIELTYRRNPDGGRLGLYRTLGQALISGFRSGIRGYFAPLRAAPWQAAWRAYRDTSSAWWAPLAAWGNTLEQISFGPPQNPDPKSGLDVQARPGQ